MLKYVISIVSTKTYHVFSSVIIINVACESVILIIAPLFCVASSYTLLLQIVYFVLSSNCKLLNILFVLFLMVSMSTDHDQRVILEQ
jgi:hypothetical protein